MEVAPTITKRKKDKAPLRCIFIALGITALALIWIGNILHSFYLDTASLAPGTSIRPMGVTAGIGVGWTVSILFGGIFATMGLYLAVKGKRWGLAILAAAALILTWVPMIVGDRGFDQIVNIRKLVLEE